MTKSPNSGQKLKGGVLPLNRRISLILLSRTSISLGIVVLVGFMGSLGAAWFFVQRQLAPLVERNLSETLNRPFNLGRVESFSLINLRFGPSAIPATPTDPDRLSVQAVDVAFNPIKLLLNRTLELDVTLVKPDVYIEQDSEGRWVSTAIKAQEGKGPIKTELQVVRAAQADIVLVPFPNAGNSKVPVAITQFNGTGRLLDNNQRIAFDLEGQLVKGGNFTIKGENRRAARQTNIAIAGQNMLAADISRLVKLDAVKLYAGRVDGNLEVQLRPEQPTLFLGIANFKQVTAKIAQVPQLFTNTTGPLGFKGTVIQLQNINTIYGQIPTQLNGALDTQSGYNISARTAPVGLKNLLNTFNLKIPVAAAAELQANLKVTGLLQKPVVSGTAITTKIAQIDRLNFRAIRTNFELAGSTLSFTGFQALPVVGGQMSGSGQIKLGQKGGVVFDVQAQNLPGDTLARIYGAAPPVIIGPVSAKAQVFGPTGNLETLVEFQAPAATYPGRGEVAIAPGGTIVFRNTIFQVAGGTVKGGGKIAEGLWQGEIQASDVPGSALAPLIGREVPPPLQGLLSGTFNLSGNTRSFKPETIQGSGSGRLQVAGGSVTATNVQLGNGNWRGNFVTNGVQLAGLSANIPAQLKPGRLSGNFNLSGDLAAIRPETITGTGSGRVNLPNGTINASSLQLAGGGWKGNFAVNNVQLASLSANIPAQLKPGRLSGNFNLSGDLAAIRPETITGTGSGRVNLPNGTINASSLQLAGGGWKGNFGVNNVQLASLSANIPAQLKPGRLSGNFNLSGSLAAIKPETITGTGSGRVNLPDGSITASALQLRGGGWKGNFALDDVQLASLSANIPAQLKPGRLSGNFNLSGSLAAIKPETITGTGSGRVNLPDGSITASSLQLRGGRWQGNFAANDVDLGRLAQLASVNGSSTEGTPSLQGRLSGTVNASGSLAAFNPRAIQASGQVRLENFAAEGLEFDPLLTGEVNIAPRQGVNLQLAGVQDRIEVALSPTFRPISFFVQRGEAIASGRTEGDRLLVRGESFPISILKTFAPLPSAIAAQPLSGLLSGNFDINLATRSIIGNNVEIDQPIIGTLKGDKLIGNFQYAGGVAKLTNAELQQGNSRYLLSGSLAQTANGPQFQGQLKIPNGQIQDILTALQIFELQDLTRGFASRTYGRAADIQPTGEGLPEAPLITQLRRFSEVEAMLAQERAREEDSPLPELKDLEGTFTGEITVAGSLQQGITANFDILGSDWNWKRYQDNELIPRYKLDRVIAQGRFEKGILTLLPLRIESGEGLVAFSGTVGGEQQSGQVRVQNFPVETLQDFVDLPVNATGNLNATATIAGSTQNPQARGEVSIIGGTLNQTPVQTAQGSFSYDEARLNFFSTALVSANDPIQITGSVPYKLPFATMQSASNEISVDINVQNQGLALLNLLSRGQVAWVDGQGKVDLSVRGTVDQTAGKIQQLVAQGVAVVQNATLNAQALPGSLTEVTGRVLFDFDRIQVESLQGRFSEGQLVASGVIPISVPQPTENPLTVTLNQLALNIKGRYSGGVNGNLVLTGAALNPQIGGALELVNGQVLLAETANASIPTASPASSGGSGSEPRETGVIGFNNLQIGLGKGVQITRPPVLNFLATGNLTINGTLDNIRPQGTVELERGQVNLFTTQFRLARGYPQTAQFLPNQGLIPNLDVRLIALVPETTRSRLPSNPLSTEISDVPATSLGALQSIRIEARVIGPANQLGENLELRSNPSRGEAEIVALLGGGFVETLGRGDTTLGLANLAGSALLGNVQNVIGDTLGLSEFRLFPTLTKDEKRQTATLGLGVEAGIDITPKISTSVSKVLTADDPPQYNLRYRVNDEILLRGSTDLSGDSRAVLEYENRF
ncbi:MAG: translocation/assembly module TamB domain-containing protein [Aphanothece sp. CMT-3BRIN-NPC111]|jgi:translocation and assembly module TamB|nr:translocation/assembly module TamB domain-containing protein [Aphanothece sp. CMT-3BRIN-NPC111]